MESANAVGRETGSTAFLFSGRSEGRFAGGAHEHERALRKRRVDEQGSAGESDAKVEVVEKQKR